MTSLSVLAEAKSISMKVQCVQIVTYIAQLEAQVQAVPLI